MLSVAHNPEWDWGTGDPAYAPPRHEPKEPPLFDEPDEDMPADDGGDE